MKTDAEAQPKLRFTNHQDTPLMRHNRDCIPVRAPLSDVLPVIENLGLHVLTENPFRIQSTNGGRSFFIFSILPIMTSATLRLERAN